MVAPLFPLSTGPKAIGRLEPVFRIEGKDHVLHAAGMAAIPSAFVKGDPVADPSASDHEIRGALDMVFATTSELEIVVGDVVIRPGTDADEGQLTRARVAAS